jgi:hypothetical protein
MRLVSKPICAILRLDDEILTIMLRPHKWNAGLQGYFHDG